MGEQIKSSLLIKTLFQKVYSYFNFHLPTVQRFISTPEESYEHLYHCPPHASTIKDLHSNGFKSHLTHFLEMELFNPKLRKIVIYQERSLKSQAYFFKNSKFVMLFLFLLGINLYIQLFSSDFLSKSLESPESSE